MGCVCVCEFVSNFFLLLNWATEKLTLEKIEDDEDEDGEGDLDYHQHEDGAQDDQPAAVAPVDPANPTNPANWTTV